MTLQKKYAQTTIDALTTVEFKLKSEQKKKSGLEDEILRLKKHETKILSKNNELFEALIDGQISNEDYRSQTDANAKKLHQYRKDIETANAEIVLLEPDANEMTDKKLLQRLLDVEILDKSLVDGLVESIEVYCGGKVNIKWKFSYFCDIMDLKNLENEIRELRK